VSGSHDETICLWDVVSGAHLNTLKGTAAVFSVVFPPDGTHIVSGSLDNTLHLWDAVSGAHLDTVVGPPFNATSLAHSLLPSRFSFSQYGATASSKNSHISGYIMDNKWIISLPQMAKLCWIPVACRPHSMTSSGNSVALGTKDGHVIFLDFIGLHMD
jgi:hypothetical protein